MTRSAYLPECPPPLRTEPSIIAITPRAFLAWLASHLHGCIQRQLAYNLTHALDHLFRCPAIAAYNGL